MRALDTPPDPALDGIVRLAAALLNMPIALVSLVDENRQWFKSRIGLDICETPRSHSFCTYATLAPGAMVVNDTTQDARFKDNPLVVNTPFIRFYAGVPLRTQSGLNIGTLCVLDSKPRAGLSEQELRSLTDLASLAMARLETLRSIGYINQLTGLPNHNRLVENIQKIILDPDEMEAPSVLVGFDIVSPQHYHDIVKAVGHRRADYLTIDAKRRLQNGLPADTTVYHIATARFAAILSEELISAPENPLNSIAQAFSKATDCDGIPINTNTSIGVIRIGPGSDAAQLLRALVSTVDDVRERGLNWDFYDPGIDIAQQRAFSILTALDTALQVDDQLTLHYQPRIGLGSGMVVGVEALLRWQHPTMGNISPAEFVPLSETTALIGAVTDWVIPHALKQAKQWRNHGYTFKVSINVSAYDIERGNFAAKMSALLAEYELEPDAIEVEFTENALIRNRTQVHEQLSRLREIGIEVAIDDFGTGYCNMSYLKSIPASVVKIDQSFVRTLCTDGTDRAIVRSMIALSHSLGHRIVAEGIETQEAYDMLREWSCDEGQGYLIARPMEPQALMQWIKDRPLGMGSSPAHLPLLGSVR
jgi:EAL domain-containing protein (putative c-di-GMP-specific phosphodiesterase class I)/GGDEF domain-containing protein